MVRDERLAQPSCEAVAEAARETTGRSVATVDSISKGINGIYRITFDDGGSAILKAATFNTAAELRPEPRLLRRLDEESSVSVPSVLAVGSDGGSLGVFHYLLEDCPGKHVSSLQPLSAERQHQLLAEIAKNLARIHEWHTFETTGFVRVADDEPGFTTTGHETWGAVVAALADHFVGLFADVHGGGKLADTVSSVVAAFDGIADTILPPRQSVLLHRDCYLDNLLVVEDERDPLVRTVLDFADVLAGDFRVDVAFAEDAIINSEFGDSNRAATLREHFRTTYAQQRGMNVESIVDERYQYYLLLQRCRWAAVAVDWEESSDPEARRRAHRTFLEERLAAVGVSEEHESGNHH